MKIKQFKNVKMKTLGYPLIRHDWCPYKKKKLGCKYIQREDHVKTQKRSSSASRRVRNHKNPTLLTTCSQTSTLQNCEKIQFCCIATQSEVLCRGPLGHQYIYNKKLAILSFTGSYFQYNWSKYLCVLLNYDVSVIVAVSCTHKI